MKKKCNPKALVAIVSALTVAYAFTACFDKPDNTVPVEYVVSYAAGEGATGTPPVGGSYTEGATFTLPAADGIAKVGYSFEYWNDSASNYAAGATYTMPAHAVTFTAVWKADEPTPPPPTEFTITFNPNNGGEKTTSKVTDGGKVAKPADPAAPEGKEFEYWADKDGNEYDFNGTVTASFELTAKYKDKIVTPPPRDGVYRNV